MRSKVWPKFGSLIFLASLTTLPVQAGAQCSAGAWGTMKCVAGRSTFYMDSNPPHGLSNLMDIEEMPPPPTPRELPSFGEPASYSVVLEVDCTVSNPKCLKQIK